MTKVDLYISKDAPNVRGGAAWLKPVDGGFALYVLENGWKPLRLVDDKGTLDEKDDITQDLIGSVQDKRTANTINGAKAYAKDAAEAVVGKASDKSSAKTIYGLKAYIDEQIAGLE